MSFARVGALAALLLLAAAAQGSAAQDSQLPAPPLPPGAVKYAIALTAGTLHTGADATAPIKLEFEAGTVFEYYGETEDPFGRTWQILGDPHAWWRREAWYVLPETAIAAAQSGQPLALLSGVPAPPASRPAVAPATALKTAQGWWTKTQSAPVQQQILVADELAVPAWSVPAAVAREAIELIGGQEALGPWPTDPAVGRIHWSPLLPLIFSWDGESWSLGDAPRSARPVLGLMANAEMAVDMSGATEMTGRPATCWLLRGAIDPGGLAVGTTGPPPVPPLVVESAQRLESEALLGAVDLAPRLLPLAPVATGAPRRLEVEPSPARGVLLQDRTAKQAVYLEQRVPAAALRGRSMRLSVRARAVPEATVAASATIGIEVQMGEEVVATSARVGGRATPVNLEFTVPENALELVVRLLPNDRSIVVQEQGGAIFETAVLAPVEWPQQLSPSPLLLRRVRLEGYVPARRYSRVAIADGDRDAAALEATWSQIAGSERTEEENRQILVGELRADMPAADVRLAWGEPETVTQLGGGAERWDWDDRSAVLDAEGRLLSWTVRPKPTEKVLQTITCPESRQ